LPDGHLSTLSSPFPVQPRPGKVLWASRSRFFFFFFLATQGRGVARFSTPVPLKTDLFFFFFFFSPPLVCVFSSRQFHFFFPHGIIASSSRQGVLHMVPPLFSLISPTPLRVARGTDKRSHQALLFFPILSLQEDRLLASLSLLP